MADKKVIYAIQTEDGQWMINQYGEIWHTASLPLAQAQAEASSSHLGSECRVVDLDMWWYRKQEELSNGG